MSTPHAGNAGSRDLSLRPRPEGWPVGSFDSYADAQAAVDMLSDKSDFPVAELTIVGVDLMEVEHVVGRLTWGRVIAGEPPPVRGWVCSLACCWGFSVRTSSPRSSLACLWAWCLALSRLLCRTQQAGDGATLPPAPRSLPGVTTSCAHLPTLLRPGMPSPGLVLAAHTATIINCGESRSY